MHSTVTITLLGLLAASSIATVHAQQREADPPEFNTIDLGAEPNDLPLDRRAQAETHLTRSYSNGNLLFGGMQEGRHFDGGAVANGYVLSTDGGATWTRKLVPRLTTANQSGPFARASDPVAGIDSQGNLYFNSLGVNFVGTNLESTQVVNRSNDGGVTFTQPLVMYTVPELRFFADKNWMAINTFPGTRNLDRVFVAFALFEAPFLGANYTSQRISTTYSDDQGATWSRLQTFGPNRIQGLLPMYLPDGSLAMPYWNYGIAPNWTDSIEIVVSNDGGRSFGSPRTVVSGLWGPSGYQAPTIRNTPAVFSGAVDRMAGVIYLTYQDRISGGPDIGPRIMFTKSIDKGATWSSPQPISDNPDGWPVAIPALAASPDGQHLTVIYYDWRHGTIPGTLIDLYFTESFDGGDTWEADRRVTKSSLDVTRAPDTGPRGYMLGDYQAITPALSFDKPGFAMWIGVPSTTNSPDPLITELPRTQGTSFAAWQKLRFKPVELNDPTISGPAADPDHDRLTNLLEYALALEPFHPDASPVTILFDHTSDTIVATYTTLPVLDDIEFGWRVSEDLKRWDSALPVSETTEVSPSAAFLTEVTAGFEVNGMSNAFYQLTVTLTEGG
ncbi:MAG: sialidase family protein [Roseibacillus sp.]|jgi:hypothetical protein|tara:strand:- start:40 stop:1881 length:1842 start_codon:yes stop_codon:yes gene_type:complete